MSIIGTIFMGFLVGLFARFLMPGRDITGFIMTTLLGIGGAFVGKYVGLGLGYYNEQEPAGFFMSLIGAMFLLFFYSEFRKRELLK